MKQLALITGGSGGIGYELAKQFAAGGFDLVLVARSAQRLEDNALALRTAYGVEVRTIAEDLGTAGAAARIAAQVPHCDVLVNNAGFASNGRFDTIPAERLREEMLLDVVTLTELTRSYLPGMRAARKGRILNVASTAAFLPGPFMAVYYAAKAYVLSFSEALAEQCRGSGVTVTCLCPGATGTGFQERANVGDTLLMRLPVADAAGVAKAGYRGAMRGVPVVVPGLSNKIVAFLPRISPRRLLLWTSRKAVERS